MRQYLDLLQTILDHGVDKTDRTGTGTRSIFGHQMRFNLAQGFPLVTTKKVHLKSIVHELLWLLAGDTNITYLVKNGVNIWNDWPMARLNKKQVAAGRAPFTMAEFIEQIKTDPSFAEIEGDLGPVYGKQWRAWDVFVEDTEHTLPGSLVAGRKGSVDQIQLVLDQLRNQPDSRRIIVNAWNVADLPEMSLSPCHAFFQFNTTPMSESERVRYMQYQQRDLWAKCQDVRMSQLGAFMDEHGVPTLRLDCQLYQRSADTMLGVPFNIASYALLTMMMAQVVNMVPGEFIWSGGDCHIYKTHIEQVKLQLTREPRPLPVMKLNPGVTDLFTFQYEDFTLEGYDPFPSIKAPVAV